MAVGTFDTLYTNLISALEAYSTASIAADKFTVYDNYMRAFPNDSSIANVFCYLGSMNPTEQAGTTFFQTEWNYYFDLVAKKPRALTGEVLTRADKAAGVRLRYLIHQVMSALFTADAWKLGLAAGEIGNKKMLRVDPLGPDDPRMTEKVIAAARLTLTVETGFEPTLLTGTELDSVLVKQDETAPLWSALLEP